MEYELFFLVIFFVGIAQGCCVNSQNVSRNAQLWYTAHVEISSLSTRKWFQVSSIWKHMKAFKDFLQL